MIKIHFSVFGGVAELSTLEKAERNYIASGMSTYNVLPLCKVSSQSLKRIRRSCADKTWTDGKTHGHTDEQDDSYIAPKPFFIGGGAIKTTKRNIINRLIYALCLQDFKIVRKTFHYVY